MEGMSLHPLSLKSERLETCLQRHSQFEDYLLRMTLHNRVASSKYLGEKGVGVTKRSNYKQRVNGRGSSEILNAVSL